MIDGVVLNGKGFGLMNGVEFNGKGSSLMDRLKFNGKGFSLKWIEQSLTARAPV